MRSSVYVACKASSYKGTHKEFTMCWCKALFSRAQAKDIRETRAQQRTLQEPASMPQAKKRHCMSHTKPELQEYHFHEARKDHHMVWIDGKKKPSTCTYCAYIAALNKGVRNFKLRCLSCVITALLVGAFYARIMKNHSMKRKQEKRQQRWPCKTPCK